MIRKTVGWFVMIAALMLVGTYFGMLIYGAKVLENNQRMLEFPQTTFVYDAENEQVVALYAENRRNIQIEDVPQLLKEAFIAIEDERFEHHTGIDLWATGRALYQDLLHMDWVEGGSTITQQLVKNMYLTSDKTIVRKISEWAIAMALENRYSKEEILELYLNQIYFGNGSYGIQAASYYYFGKKDLNELELWEAATLAAIPKSPSLYSPIDNPDASNARRKLVLASMLAQGKITEQQANEAAEVEYELPERKLYERYNKYIDYVFLEAEQKAGLTPKQIYEGGYHIYTTMDANAQQVLESTFQMDELFPPPGPEQIAQGAMVILDHESGGIVATIGGRDNVMRGFNRVLAPRQPGSVMKPLAVYAPAIDSGQWHPYSSLVDQKLSFSGYKPSNYDDQYAGSIELIDALRLSKNVPAVWLLERIGLDTSLAYLKRVGIELTEEDRHLSLALGGVERGVSPLEIAAAYAAFAREGTWIEPYAIRKIVDAEGKVIYEHKPKMSQAYSPKTAYEMTVMLKQVVDSGTGQAAKMKRPAAGKTGSTQAGLRNNDASGFRDAWFVGYTAERTSAVWVGFDRTDENHVLRKGSYWPAKIFQQVMSKSLQSFPVQSFSKPEGVSALEKRSDDPLIELDGGYEKSVSGVYLTWDHIPGALTYQVYRKKAGEQRYHWLQSSVLPEVTDLQVESGEAYDYTVRTVMSKSQTASVFCKPIRIEIPA